MTAVHERIYLYSRCSGAPSVIMWKNVKNTSLDNHVIYLPENAGCFAMTRC